METKENKMRHPAFISPSALGVWITNPEDYYLRYLAENQPPKDPQTQPMSIGSAFDAYVKNYMFETLFGKTDGQFDFETIFESQVEPHNREWALVEGARAFELYKNCGALADLLLELENAADEPRFEFTVKGVIEGVPLLGKPDVWYVNKAGCPVILDFKVNGWCSKYATSPKRGYVRVRPGNGEPHKKAIIDTVNGVKINIAEFLESIESTWAQQIATYAWLCGAGVGDYFIVAVEQLCGRDRVAEHRCAIGSDFQHAVIAKYKELWEIIHSDHIFRDRTLEESKARCGALDMKYAAYVDSPGEDWIKSIS